jgi:hypothetical protein
MTHAPARRWSRGTRVFIGLVATAAVAGTATVALASSGGDEGNPAQLSAFVPIEEVAPNVVSPPAGANGSTGVFTVDCGTNANRKFNADNPVAQPGVRNGAQHIHDYVGNLSINADSTDESLEASDTTCTNGDKSAYFWPVVRINTDANTGDEPIGDPAISCPTVADRLPAVPQRARAEVDQNLALLDKQITDASKRLTDPAVKSDPNFVNNAVLGPLMAKRVATLDRIAIAIGRDAPRPTGLESFAACFLNYGVKQARQAPAPATGSAPATLAGQAVDCPSVRDKLPGVPVQAVEEVNRNLSLLDSQIAEANQRLATSQGQGGANFVDNAILGPLRDKRVATLDRITIAIGRNAPRPTGLESLAACALGDSGGEADEPEELPGPAGPDFEIGGNVGEIVQPASVLVEYRGNAASKVVPMPKFLRALTGESKPTSRGPANARPSWTCGGFADRLSDQYVICPEGSQVMRVHDFASCWDGENTDSANHRDHLRFPDPDTGACPAGTQAVPQLRITIAYDIPTDVQQKGQYQLDAFDEENHNPASDHDDFLNVNSEETMAGIADCVNAGRRCT